MFVFNVEKRALSSNKFDANFYKVCVNSLFGKTIEDPKKRAKVRLCRTRGNWKEASVTIPSNVRK